MATVDLAAADSGAPLIGVLLLRPRESLSFPEVFTKALHDLGYGRARVEYREARGQTERLPALARELVQLNVDVLVTTETPAVWALKEATTTIPIVMTSGDPVGTGLVSSLARPGGNITGFSATSFDAAGKQLELVRGVVPQPKFVGILLQPRDPFHAVLNKQMRRATTATGLTFRRFDLERPTDLDTVIERIARDGVAALIVQPVIATPQLAELAIKYRIATITSNPKFARQGGLMSYGADLDVVYRDMAAYVSRVLKGARPAELPIEQPTTFSFVVNLKTAQTLGLTIPKELLLRADQIIE